MRRIEHLHDAVIVVFFLAITGAVSVAQTSFPGNVGVGTSSPAGPLHVRVGTNQDILLVANDNGADSGAAGVVAINDANSAYVPLGFYASSYFLGGGNVGIGTTSPSYPLDVSGIIRSSAAPNASWVGAATASSGAGGTQAIMAGQVNGSFWTGAAGQATASNGVGVYGNATSASGYGGYFTNSGGGPALITGSGSVGIGTTSPAYSLDVAGKIHPSLEYVGQAGIGGAQSNGFNIQWSGSHAYLWIDYTNVGYFSLNSDRRLKQDIATLPSGLALVNQLRPVTYRLKDIPNDIFTDDGVTHTGFIADEVQQVIPSAVNGASGALTQKGTIQPQSLSTIDIVAVLTKAVQELAAQNQALQARVTALEAKIQ